ncbi:MAG TPA: hypothetical protein PLQ35_08920 [bacterium]|nr:hypothetical protein [bacterium]HQL62403.1 hypothetical protein [bacterium]
MNRVLSVFGKRYNMPSQPEPADRTNIRECKKGIVCAPKSCTGKYGP